ncbi:sc3 hydrophobin [Stygiomarasmius scandens]|uniref:Hydrophobin n=1 Tax=Marasmiellus scandens TaxID=2682957 RepID=A0ABR1JRH4_9AGAR
MQFTRLASLAALATLAVATPTRRNEPASSCTTGPIQCCNSVESASSSSVTKLIGLLGIVLQDVNVLVGLTCDPISVIGVGGDSCSANPVCCEDNSHGGLISIGCVPVDLNL